MLSDKASLGYRDECPGGGRDKSEALWQVQVTCSGLVYSEQGEGRMKPEKTFCEFSTRGLPDKVQDSSYILISETQE